MYIIIYESRQGGVVGFSGETCLGPSGAVLGSTTAQVEYGGLFLIDGLLEKNRFFIHGLVRTSRHTAAKRRRFSPIASPYSGELWVHGFLFEAPKGRRNARNEQGLDTYDAPSGLGYKTIAIP